MFVECQRFIEFNDRWGRTNTRDGLTCEPITLNTEYIATLRRYQIAGGFEFCSVWMVDQGNNFVVDKTYEEMRDLLKASRQ